jgi:glycerophosphoryl diester phosphodiesterase
MSAPAPGPSGGVLVLGHRGSQSSCRPENTVAAVSAALDSGADGVEVDVRLSADGVLVCSHDARVGVPFGRALTVATKNAALLRRLSLPGGHRLATLAEVLRAVGQYPGARLVVEVKPVADPATALRTVRALRRALARHPRLDVTVSSFDADMLRAVRGACDGLVARTALLGEPGETAHDLLRHVVADGHDELHVPLSALRWAPEVIEAAHRVGVAVTCWAVNLAGDLRWVGEQGVDAVITDDVTTARAALAGLTARQAAGAQRTAC